MGVPLVPFTCRRHGWVLDTFPTATVWCRCKRQASPPAEVVEAQRRLRHAANAKRSRDRKKALVREVSKCRN